MKFFKQKEAAACTHGTRALKHAIGDASTARTRSWLAFTSGLMLSAVSSVASALGLGSLQAHSYLGQPLFARIELVNVSSDLDTNFMMARSVSGDEAQALGAEVFYGAHVFDVNVTEDQGRFYVELSSDVPVKEPYLSLLLELRWPSGVVYREYPVLLDPPPILTAPEQAESQSAREPKSTGVHAAQSTPRPQSPARDNRNLRFKGIETSEGRYTVRPGDNLSKISERWVEGTDQSIQNINQWLFENNPEAFINSDIDRLRAGASLRMPELSTMQAANQPVETTTTASSTAPPASVENSAVSDESQADETAQVTRAASNDAASVNENIRGLLTLSEGMDDKSRELIDMLARENANLKARMETMESAEVVETMRELVLAQQKQIRDLQQKLGESEQTPAEMQALFESAGIDKTAVELASTAPDLANNLEEKTVQEVLLDQNNNSENLAVEDTNEDAIIEVEPQGVSAILNQDQSKRSRLLAALAILGGILIVVVTAMLLYYRKMVRDTKFSTERFAREFEDQHKAPAPSKKPGNKTTSKAYGEPLQESKFTPINYDMPASDEPKIPSREDRPWYGEKVAMEDDTDLLADLNEELANDFSDFSLDEDFLQDAREDRVDMDEVYDTGSASKSHTEAKSDAKQDPVTQGKTDEDVPAGKSKATEKVRRSDEEVRNSIAEKMSQYSSDNPRNEELFATLELDELDHLEGDEYDDVEIVIQRALMYCEFKKFDKAQQVIEMRKEFDTDSRLDDALRQIDKQRAALEKRNAG